MFDKLKDLNNLRKLKNAAESEVFEVEKNGVKVSMNGGFAVVDIKLNPDLEISSQEKILKECFKEAFGKAQMAMAKKFSGFM